MSTKQTTDTTNKYDPTSLGTMQTMLGPGTGGGGGFTPGGGSQGGFNPSGGNPAIGGFQNRQGMFTPSGAQGGPQAGGLGNVTANYINNPFSNPFFQTQQQLGTRQAQGLGGAQLSNLLHNITASGMAGGASSPAGVEMQQNQGRSNTNLQAQLGFLNPVQNALGMQQGAMGLAAGYRPLQTGGTQVQSTSGLGTWLPQVAGAALGGLTGGGAGALGSLFQGHQMAPSLPGGSMSDPGGGLGQAMGWGGATPGLPGGVPMPFPGGGGYPGVGNAGGGNFFGGGGGMMPWGGYGATPGIMPSMPSYYGGS